MTRHYAMVLVGMCAVAASTAMLGGGGVAATQPAIGVRSRAVLTVDGQQFKDANGNGAVDRYEDWRLPVDVRVDDLVSRMTLDEKAGLMLIDTMGPGCGGTLTPAGTRLIETQKMTRFILRNVVKATADPCDGSVTPGRSGYVVTPRQMAEFTNAVQALAESQRLGIPVLFKDNARNHYDTDPRFGISAGAGAFTEFPKEAGVAAAALGAGDMSPVKALAEVMSQRMARHWPAWHVRLHGRPGDRAPLVPRSGDVHRRRRPQRGDHEDAGPGAAGRPGEPVDRRGADAQALSGRRSAGARARSRTIRSASGRSIQADASSTTSSRSRPRSTRACRRSCRTTACRLASPIRA